MSAPSVPQRPARSQNPPSKHDSPLDTPQVPPRPARRMDKSPSRERGAYARSPLNDHSFAPTSGPPAPPSSNGSKDPASALPRPPSVASLPMVGQEGIEYASLENVPKPSQPVKDPMRDPNETRSVASDLPLHAPKASASPMTAKSRIAQVTRTDSSKAAVAGVGKPRTEYIEPDTPAIPPAAHQDRPPSAVSIERPSSEQTVLANEAIDEQGIPEIGVQVPMNPMAGDVQAPTPGPSVISHSTGASQNDSGQSEGRKRSAMSFQGPPGSYGLHGHGLGPQDSFDKAWYQKHPEELAKEASGAYGPALASERPPWAMSSDELNKLVHESASRGPGLSMKPARTELSTG